MPQRLNAGVVASLSVCTLFACDWGRSDGNEHDDNDFRGDVIECEDALSRLETCCPSFDPTPILCNFHFDKSTGCGSTTTNSVEPAFTRTESSCIRDTSCDELVTRNVCSRAQAARAYTKSTSDSSNTSSSYGGSATYDNRATSASQTHQPVCP